MRIAILGAGPAGMLAALIAHRAGAEVTWATAGPDAPQAPHIHVLRGGITEVLASIDPCLGVRIEAVTEHEHPWQHPDGTVHMAPRLTRHGLVAALWAAVSQSDLHPVPLSPGEMSAFDRAAQGGLRIDATGAGRLWARLLDDRGEARLELDDIGSGAIWRTETWPDVLPEAPFTLCAPGQGYLEATHTGVRLTGWDAGADLLHSLPCGLKRPAPSIARLAAPPVRLARLESLAEASGLVLFGDALLQTPPAMGFGLMAVALQAQVLQRALAGKGDVAAELLNWAKAMWTAAGVQSALDPSEFRRL